VARHRVPGHQTHSALVGTTVRRGRGTDLDRLLPARAAAASRRPRRVTTSGAHPACDSFSFINWSIRSAVIGISVGHTPTAWWTAAAIAGPTGMVPDSEMPLAP
jgi:hypothetical protein